MRVRSRGPLRVADMAPSRGARRFKYRHKGHKPGKAFSGEGSSTKVVRMYEALKEQGWTFEFVTEAISPRGFRYRGAGASPLEAFLKAFGQWQRDLGSFTAKIPAILVAAKPSPPPVGPRRAWKKTRIKELLELVGPSVAALSPNCHQVPPSPDPKINRDRVYRRLYMRAYRSGRLRKRSNLPVAAAA